MCLPFPSPTQLLLRFFVTGFQQLIMMCYVVDFISLKSSLNFLNLYIYSFLHIRTNFRQFLLKYFSVSPSHDPPVTAIIHVLGQLVLMYRSLMHCSFFSCLFFVCVSFFAVSMPSSALSFFSVVSNSLIPFSGFLYQLLIFHL